MYKDNKISNKKIIYKALEFKLRKKKIEIKHKFISFLSNTSLLECQKKRYKDKYV